MKRERQPPPGREGGVRNDYDGPLDYDPESGQYVDPVKKCFVNIATGEEFTDLGAEALPPLPQKSPSSIESLFNGLSFAITNMVDFILPDNRPSKEQTRAIIRQKLDQIKNS